MIRRLIVGLAMALLVAGCARVPVPDGGAADPVEIPGGTADQPTPTADPSAPDLPDPHPHFVRYFTDPLYADQGDEFSPFGSDEGADTLAEWVERRDELTSTTTVRQMLEEEGGPDGILDDAADNGPDVDGFLIGAGFTLILITGQIDCEGRQLVIDALKRTYSYYADDRPREPAVMIRDLRAFPAGECRA